MTLDQLETFKAVADEGGLRAASKVLHKTQPTLSTGIKNLEQELGLNLLDRDSYRVKLTPSGELLLLKAREILDKVREFEVSAREQAMGKEAQIKLAIDYLCPMHSILTNIHEFSSQCGDTKIEMDFEVLSGSENKLINNQVNIAITPFITHHSQTVSEKICDIEILPVISIRHLEKPRFSSKDLLKIPQIIVKDSSSIHQSSSSFNAQSESPKYIVSDHHIKRELIINGFGWGHLEKSSISRELEEKKLKKISLKGFESKKIPLYIARSQEYAIGPVTNDLWDFILSKFRL
jgi:DNA-binding transcriptional LysR family regulator